MSSKLFSYFCYAWLGLAAAVFILMFFITAPFGRHTKSTWGPVVNERLAWALMELPSFAVMAIALIVFPNCRQNFVWVIFALWLFHYANRCFIYPFRIRKNPKGMPLAICLMGQAFNLINASINAWYLARLASPGQYGIEWILSPRFFVGFTVFFCGLAINWVSDSMLISLRKRGESGYTLPRGFLFEYVASPNLLGEIIEWGGFALLAWNLPALCFFAWTCANLIPRAKNHWDWSRKYFPDYPKKRRILIPLIFICLR
jgi:3-oxo-5-alpha-steroid 4-dehydrogenase 1